MMFSPVETPNGFEGEPVTLTQVLQARDERAAIQQDLLHHHGGCLVCLTVNMPGPVKRCPAGDRIFSHGCEALYRDLPIDYGQVRRGPAGCEGYFIILQDTAVVKMQTCTLEDTHPLGRLWDIDVLSPTGIALSRRELGLPARRCLLCNCEAMLCARSRTHPITELLAEMGRRLSAWEASL